MRAAMRRLPFTFTFTLAFMFTFTFTLALAFTPAAARAEGTLQQVTARKTLRVGMLPGLAPFVAVGADAEELRRLLGDRAPPVERAAAWPAGRRCRSTPAPRSTPRWTIRRAPTRW